MSFLLPLGEGESEDGGTGADTPRFPERIRRNSFFMADTIGNGPGSEATTRSSLGDETAVD